jgi:PAS domain S-box-containing protein
MAAHPHPVKGGAKPATLGIDRTEETATRLCQGRVGFAPIAPQGGATGDDSTIDGVPYFICPNCKQRSVDHDRLQELDDVPVACESCGFGFLFELMEDYYPAPNSGFVVCDQEGRVLAAGRGVFELTGYNEQELLGNDVVQGLGLSGFEADRNPAKLALDWGVRRMGEQLRLRSRAGQEKPVTADFFPAYDEDGGLLVALTPRG